MSNHKQNAREQINEIIDETQGGLYTREEAFDRLKELTLSLARQLDSNRNDNS